MNIIKDRTEGRKDRDEILPGTTTKTDGLMAMKEDARRNWNRSAWIYDLLTFMEVWGRSAEARAEVLREARGRTLEVGVGTGHNIRFYPEGSNIVAIDISEKMLARARAKAKVQKKKPAFMNMDIETMAFKDHSFDTVVSTCVFCSVPDPVAGFLEIKRVLKPGGRLIMYEHMLSRNPFLAFMLNAMNPFTIRLKGPYINRDTMGNIAKAGLKVLKERNVRFFDVFRRIDAIGD